jgi:hypothetical protein
LDAEIERILREAEEVLREAQAPSGGWAEARPAVAEDGGEWGRADRENRSWPGIGGQGIDAEAAFWLLFPPRGHA